MARPGIDQRTLRQAGRKFAWLCWLALVAGLLGVVVATGVSRVYQDTEPSRALVWWPYNTDAAVALADKQLKSGSIEGRREADRLAREVLRSAPLNYKALRILGLLAVEQRQFDTADAFMAAAVRRSNRDTPSQLWIFRRAAMRGDFQAAFRAVDAILRRRSQERQTLFRAMFAILGYAHEARPALAERLTHLPGWRSSFLQAYTRAAASPDLIEALFAAIDRTTAPVTDQEFAFYVARLVQAKEYQRAHAAWSARLPPDRSTDGLVYDGGFELGDAPPPFGWTIRRGAGLLVERARPPQQATKALHIEFGGSGKSQSIAEQLLVLPAGDYIFSARSLFFSTQEPDRIGWTLVCEGGSTIMDIRERAPAFGKWITIQVSFAVPAGCAGQRLRLRVVSGDTQAPISVWYDDLMIAPAPASQAIQ